jgi:hypothetical protein
MSARDDRIPLIFIHGAWLSARSWENYVDYFGTREFDRVPAVLRSPSGTVSRKQSVTNVSRMASMRSTAGSCA